MPKLIDGLIADVADEIEDLIDFKHMLVTRLEGDKELLNRLFLEAGSVEFRFIVRSGLYFGFLFGLIQLAVWIFYKAWWVLPAFGISVGYATNWLAINIIFRPLHPRRVLGRGRSRACSCAASARWRRSGAGSSRPRSSPCSTSCTRCSTAPGPRRRRR